MKITGVRVHCLGYLEKEPWDRIRNFALVEVETDSGITGIGESSDCYGHSYPRVIETIVADVLRRYVIGEDPRDVPRLVKKMSVSYQHFGPYGAVVEAVSGIETALWDIAGKDEGKPVHRLIGGSKDRIPVYAGGPLDFTRTPAECAEFYGALAKKGLKAVKIRIGKDPKWDKEFVKLTREEVGEKTKIMVDGFMNYTVSSAVRTSKMLARYDVFYFEEPIPFSSLDSMSELRKRSETPIAVGEHVYLHNGFEDILNADAADYLTPDVTVCGGISECLKIFELAKTGGIPVVQHCGGLTAVGIAANLHALSALKGATFLEYDSKPSQPLRDELPREPIFDINRLVDGDVRIPQGWGMGIELRREILQKYPSISLPEQHELPTYGMGLIK